MGGLWVVYQDFYYMNLDNFVFLVFFRVIVFEVGLGVCYFSWESFFVVDNQWSGNLRYLVLGFFLFNFINEVLDCKDGFIGWGMSIVLVLYILVGYDIEFWVIDENFDVVINVLKGKGGIYCFCWGNVFCYKGFFVGVNLNYSFGKFI